LYAPDSSVTLVYSLTQKWEWIPAEGTERVWLWHPPTPTCYPSRVPRIIFSRTKRTGREANHPTPACAESQQYTKTHSWLYDIRWPASRV